MWVFGCPCGGDQPRCGRDDNPESHTAEHGAAWMRDRRSWSAFQFRLTSRNGKNRTLRPSKDIRLKENAPECDYSSFYVTTGTGTPAALLRRI